MVASCYSPALVHSQESKEVKAIIMTIYQIPDQQTQDEFSKSFNVTKDPNTGDVVIEASLFLTLAIPGHVLKDDTTSTADDIVSMLWQRMGFDFEQDLGGVLKAKLQKVGLP